MTKIRLSDPSRASLRDAIEYLASVCDGARRQDGHGFGTDHVILGADLMSHARWGVRRRRAARRLVRIYRQQLISAGFRPNEILNRRQRAVFLPRPRLVDERWVSDPTGIHKLRYWNGRRWTQHVA